MKAPTPRTDECIRTAGLDHAKEAYALARTLERELAAMTERTKRMAEALRPFVIYTRLHGATTLMGMNGAKLNWDAWINEANALADQPAQSDK